MTDQEQYHWMSFIDPDKPQGQRFLGVAICQGADIGEAAKNAWEHGCNPGGEVAALPMTLADLEKMGLTTEHLNILLTKADLEQAQVRQVT